MQAQRIFQIVDKEGKNYLNQQEFVFFASVIQQKKFPNKYEMYFKFADNLEKGVLSFDETLRVCRIMDYAVGDAELEQAMGFYGRDAKLTL